MTPGYNYRHGMRHSLLYSKYYSMLTRCTNPLDKGYKNYGARGIECLWATFEDFHRDMGDSYEAHVAKHGGRRTTLERIDNNSHYSKDNCRWATPAEQNRNSRNCHWIEFRGRKMLLNDWAREFGLKRTTLIMRLNNYGWSVEKALTTPVGGHHHP